MGLRKVYYINLDERVDRRESLQAALDKEELKVPIGRVAGCRNRTPRIGCAQAHMNVLKAATTEFGKGEEDWILILEDDAAWEQGKLRDVLEGLKSEDFMNVYYLGFTMVDAPQEDQVSKDVLGRVKLGHVGGLGGHAYVVRLSYAIHLIRLYIRVFTSENLALDQLLVYSRSDPNLIPNHPLQIHYAAWPRIVHQGVSYSDIEGGVRDYTAMQVGLTPPLFNEAKIT